MSHSRLVMQRELSGTPHTRLVSQPGMIVQGASGSSDAAQVVQLEATPQIWVASRQSASRWHEVAPAAAFTRQKEEAGCSSGHLLPASGSVATPVHWAEQSTVPACWQALQASACAFIAASSPDRSWPSGTQLSSSKPSCGRQITPGKSAQVTCGGSVR